MSTTTTNLGLTLPTPNVDTGWGSTLNTDFTLIDNIFASNGSGTSVGLNIGSGKTLLLGGTAILGTGDGTGTVTAPTIRGAAATGSNVTGANLTIQAANGTGTGGSGNIVFQTAPAASSGSTAGTFQNALVIGKSSSTNIIDIGAGGTGSTNARSSVRINGSSAGDGTNGGAILRISNNGTDAGSIGNRSAVFGGSTAYDSSMTMWGSSSLSFFVGSGALAASDEKLRLGSSGQFYVWDSTLGTPALYAGSAGQVFTSGGSGGAASWEDPSINQVASQTFLSGGNSFTGIPATVKTVILTVASLDPTADVRIQLGTSSGYVTTGYASSGSAVTASGAATDTSTTGFLINITGSVGSGSIRLTHMGSNVWVCDHTIGTSTSKTCIGGGVVTLPGVLDRVQIIPDTGTFAASGSFNLMYL